MKLRTLAIVVLVLVLLSAVAFYLQRPAPPPSADARIGQSLVESSVIEQTATLKLSDQGKTVTVARQPDNSWTVASYHDLPADFSKLSRFISELGEARLQRLVTSNPDRIARLEFKDTKIELLDSANKPLTALTLGKHAEAGGGRYVRFADESKAYLANLTAWIDAEAKNWADAQLLDVKADDVAKAEITFPEGGRVVVSRAKKDDPWQAEGAPEGQQLKADRVTSLLSSLGNLRFSDTTEPDSAAAQTARQHQRQIKLTTFDQKTVTVALGRKPEEKKLKPPAPSTDGQTGPAALGSISDLTKAAPTGPAAAGEKAGDEQEPAGPKPLTPEFETIPAGPVFVLIAHSDPAAPVNALMSKRAFQVADYVYTGLPQKPDEFYEPATPPPAEPTTPPQPSSAPAPEQPPSPMPAAAPQQ